MGNGGFEIMGSHSRYKRKCIIFMGGLFMTSKEVGVLMILYGCMKERRQYSYTRNAPDNDRNIGFGAIMSPCCEAHKVRSKIYSEALSGQNCVVDALWYYVD